MEDFLCVDFRALVTVSQYAVSVDSIIHSRVRPLQSLKGSGDQTNVFMYPLLINLNSLTSVNNE